MPITENVHWDERLEAFKGVDTTLFVTAAAARAKKCADCQKSLEPGATLSLIVDIQQGQDFEETRYRHYDTYVCHRECQAPDVALREVPQLGVPEEVDNFGTRFVVGLQTTFGVSTTACLAYTLLSNITIREEGRERQSAALASLFSQGFQLSTTAEYADIITHARDVKASYTCTLSPHGLVTLQIDGTAVYTLQLDPSDNDDALWLNTARTTGKILVLSGEHLHITETELDIEAAAKLGSLVVGYVAAFDSPAGK